MLRFRISLVMLISNGTVKINLAILAFLCCGEFVKTSTWRLVSWLLLGKNISSIQSSVSKHIRLNSVLFLHRVKSRFFQMAFFSGIIAHMQS